jgi:ATP-binding cassette, subfamily B, bacterial
MATNTSAPSETLWHELQLVVRRAIQVWWMVPRRHRWTLGGAAFLMTLASAIATSVPLLLGRLVDGIKAGTDQRLSNEELFRFATAYLLAIAGLVLLREVLHVIRRFLVENTCTRIDKHLSVQVVSHLLQSDLATLTHEKVGALHGRVFRSIDGFMRLLRLSFLDFFPALLTGLFALTTALVKQPWIGLAMIGVIPSSIALTAWQLRSQKGVRLRLLRSREELDGTVVEQLGGLEYVRVAHTHAQEVKRVASAAEKRRSKELSHHVSMSLFGMSKALTEGLFHLLVLALAVYLAVLGRITYGDILTFSILFLSVMTPLAEVHRVIDEGHEASLRVGDLMDILALAVDRSFTTVTHRVPRLDDGAPVIEVEGLHVEYRTAKGKGRRVLDNLSLAIRRGETIGIVGRSGCGKTTLVRVIMRLVHPKGGRVFLKGVPLEDVSRQAISRLIGYVGQSPFMFAGTIEQNICYGCTAPCLPEEVRLAAQRACIHDEIMLMPEGYATQVAERGQNLSGGQKQRLALARIFLQDPPILILDEATSALDTISERSVQRAIDAARAERTVILIAHRLSTLIDADRILVVNQGRVAESGTYDDLIKRGGIFTDLVMSAEKDAAAGNGEVTTEAATSS